MENKWIPVTEGLPEAEEIVLVTDGRKTGQRIVVKAFRYLDGDESKWHGPIGMHEVIAWMPLPEPWDGKEERRNDSNADTFRHSRRAGNRTAETI